MRRKRLLMECAFRNYRRLSPDQIGKILNVTGEAVKYWIHLGRLPAVKMQNGYWKIRVADVEGFLKHTQIGQPTCARYRFHGRPHKGNYFGYLIEKLRLPARQHLRNS